MVTFLQFSRNFWRMQKKISNHLTLHTCLKCVAYLYIPLMTQTLCVIFCSYDLFELLFPCKRQHENYYILC